MVDVVVGEADLGRPVGVAVELLVQLVGVDVELLCLFAESQLGDRVRAGGVQVGGEHLGVAAAGARAPLEELTEREREVLALIAEGHSNEAIGERLFLSARTVETHIRQIFLKLGLRDAPAYHRRVVAVLAFLRSS